MGRDTVSHAGQEAELTKNEGQILCLLMQSGGTIVPRETIMNALWQSDTFIDDNTLTVNINRLRKKMCIRDRVIFGGQQKQPKTSCRCTGG